MTDEEMVARHKERQDTTESEKSAAPTKVGDALKGMFSGRERDRNCRACGQAFVQRELSSTMARWVAALPDRAQRIWTATVTENALPLFCVTCERREIGQSRVFIPESSGGAAA